jgi:hypothetical protein
MADRRRTDESAAASFRRDDWRDLAAALRREARAERPPFAPALHEGVLATLAARSVARADRPAAPAGHEPAVARPRRALPWSAATGGLAAAVACLAVAVVTVGPRPAPPAALPVAADTEAGIERLPTPDEIGATVFAQISTFAALAVGVPELPDLTALAPGLVANTEDPPP